MADRYLPVPVWNNRTGQWEPVDMRAGQRVVRWPEQVDPAILPDPEYHDGDRIQFVRDETCAREGTVRMVLLRGGIYGPHDSLDVLIQDWYRNPESITYIVAARGHNHTIKAANILGRFISPSETVLWRTTMQNR